MESLDQKVLNKTFGEIRDAFLSGKNVIIRDGEDNYMVYKIDISYSSDNTVNAYIYMYGHTTEGNSYSSIDEALNSYITWSMGVEQA